MTTHEHMADSAMREQIRTRYLKVDTSNVADALDMMGLFDQGLHSAFSPYPASADRLAGWAYTIQGQMIPYSGTGDPQKMVACQGLSNGEVSVWAGDGEGICYFGELIAIGLKERGCVGALVDGGIRDVRWIGKLNFPVYAAYRTSVQSIGRWKVNSVQAPVYLRGATVKRVVINPGDFILADEDGALVIPAKLAEEVLETAELLTAKEVKIREELNNGLSLDEALKKYGHV